MNTFEFFVSHAGEILARSAEHLMLAAVATFIAAAIGLPLGIFLSRRPAWQKPVLGFAGILQTIPSLALLGFLIPVPYLGGIGARTAVFALVLYALLPIVRNTVTGIVEVDPAVREAGRGMGMTDGQLLRMVELPLAAAVIFAGVRVSLVISIGIATIAAYIGAGGLGMYIFRGISTLDNRLILAGAIPAALLALLSDAILGMLETRLRKGISRPPEKRS